jgi:hypothetical protein
MIKPPPFAISKLNIALHAKSKQNSTLLKIQNELPKT